MVIPGRRLEEVSMRAGRRAGTAVGVFRKSLTPSFAPGRNAVLLDLPGLRVDVPGRPSGPTYRLEGRFGGRP